MKPHASFWNEMTQLIRTKSITIDEPKGNPHPLDSEVAYSIDYVYLKIQCHPTAAELTYGWAH
jgi:hypothetical protein